MTIIYTDFKRFSHHQFNTHELRHRCDGSRIKRRCRGLLRQTAQKNARQFCVPVRVSHSRIKSKIIHTWNTWNIKSVTDKQKKLTHIRRTCSLVWTLWCTYPHYFYFATDLSSGNYTDNSNH